MALDFYYTKDIKLTLLVFSLNDEEFEILGPVFLRLKETSGLAIDQYGKTKIHYDQIQSIIKFIKIDSEVSKTDFKLNKELILLKEKFASVDADLIAIGD